MSAAPPLSAFMFFFSPYWGGDVSCWRGGRLPFFANCNLLTPTGSKHFLTSFPHARPCTQRAASLHVQSWVLYACSHGSPTRNFSQDLLRQRVVPHSPLSSPHITSAFAKDVSARYVCSQSFARSSGGCGRTCLHSKKSAGTFPRMIEGRMSSVRG